MKRYVIKFLCLCTAIVILFVSCHASAAETNAATVAPVDFQVPAFIRGMDVSSVVALENSGVVFRNADGNKEDLFKILADNGVNYIRVRVWNDPYAADGNGYGGGNNDVRTAAEIGKRAARYGLKLLVDFHYSDFWADPGKQKAPKAWIDLSIDDKCTALYDFTAASLRTIRGAGARIGMVQLGNETNLGIAGENTWYNMARLYNAGSRAVRAFDPDVLVAIHYTNPENTYIRTMADFLNEYNVDYDVFATSYYPCWHGSLSSLTDTLNYTADHYNKYTLVAETSYPYTLDDSDGHTNTVSEWNNSAGADMLWDFSPQGQADEVRAVMDAVNNVNGGKGLGVFYWEGAWITVGDVTGLSGKKYQSRVALNQTIWEKFGSGWAASFCAEYDPDDGGQWHGGSAVDNQAFFAPDGTALPSLRVFLDVLPDGSYRLGDADGSGNIDIIDATIIQRTCALIPVNIDPKTLSQGEVDGDGILSIIDATFIRRYLASIYTFYPIGVWKQPNDDA